jgi:hypothetical protein
VEENLDISRRTADRWCEWFAVEAGLKPGTSRQVTKSEDDEFYAAILNDHRGETQIAFNCWVKTAIHTQFTKALAKIQKQLGLKNKKEAMVRGVLYAATAINGKAKSGSSATMVGHVSLRQQRSKARGHQQVRTAVRPANRSGKAKRNVPMVARGQSKSGHKLLAHGSDGHRGASGTRVMRATAGR